MTGITIEVDTKLINEMLNFIKNNINSFSVTQKVIFNYALSHFKISSLIDVYIGNWIFNIKIINNFETIFEDVILELLCQKAILDSKLDSKLDNNTKTNFIGVMLPINSEMMWFDVSNWDSNKLFDILNTSSRSCSDDLCVTRPPDLNSLFGICNLNIFGFPCKRVDEPGIGSHVPTNDVYPENLPFQTFITNPRSMNLIRQDQVNYLMSKKPQNAIWFVHAAYLINLCNPTEINVTKLDNEYTATRLLGCKGLVFHVGSHTSLSYEQGFANMVTGMRRILANVTIETPLILETPAGEGTEIGGSYESFCILLEQFMNELGKTLRVCVDTCHVFNMGYDPLWFIQNLNTTYPNSVAVVHFNDSQNERGSRVDRHHIAGLGYIGYERMMNVYNYCMCEKIPMIRE